MRRLRRAKIVATLGPASSSADMIAKLFAAGADVFRINMSHTTHDRMRELIMASEDFSFMLEAKPGAYINIGNGDGKGSCPVHNPGYDFNDEVIPLGAGYLAALVEESLPLK